MLPRSWLGTSIVFIACSIASVSAAASGGSRVWYDRRGLSEVVRLAPHYYNTDAEIDAVVAAFEALRV